MLGGGTSVKIWSVSTDSRDEQNWGWEEQGNGKIKYGKHIGFK